MSCPPSWLDEHSKWMASAILAGEMSYASMASALNAKFGTNYSRNALIGRASRMGLINPYRIKAAKKEPKPKVHRSRQRYSPESRRVLTIFENAEQIKVRCVEIVPLHVSVLDLEPDMCRYPYGDSALTFCGHSKMAPYSYCAPHKHLCFHLPAKITEEERERRRRQALRNHKAALVSA